MATTTHFVTVFHRFALFDEARVEVVCHVELQSHSQSVDALRDEFFSVMAGLLAHLLALVLFVTISAVRPVFA